MKTALLTAGFDATAVALAEVTIEVGREPRWADVPSEVLALKVIALLRVLSQLHQEIHQ